MSIKSSSPATWPELTTGITFVGESGGGFDSRHVLPPGAVSVHGQLRAACVHDQTVTHALAAGGCYEHVIPLN